jgi:hypothetical protein
MIEKIVAGRNRIEHARDAIRRLGNRVVHEGPAYSTRWRLLSLTN